MEGCNTSESDEFEVGVISGAHRTSDTQHGNSFPSVKLERAATQSPVAAILKTAGEVRVAFSNKDSVDDFIRLNDEIAVNEAAKEESLDYTKAIWDIDKEEATKHLDEIKELMLAINKGKRRRDAALAAVAGFASMYASRSFESDTCIPIASHNATATAMNQQLSHFRFWHTRRNVRSYSQHLDAMETRALSSSSAGQERIFRPEESVAQYEDDFKRWLGARGVTVKSLESRPEVEQLFRHDFTALRAWELQQSRAAQQSCKLDDSSDSEEEGKSEKIGGTGIPSVGDSGEYEEVFQKWLRHRKLTLQMLLNHPEEERRYRQCYAYSRVRTHMKIRITNVTQTKPKSKQDPHKLNAHSIDMCSRNTKSTFSENGDTFPAAQMDALSATDTAVLIPPAHEDNLLAVIQQHRVVEADAEAQTLRQTEEPIVGSASVDLVPDSSALLNAAAEILARVERISTDLAKTRLVERYIRFTIRSCEGEETEIIDQVEEAIMTVNEVKMQRDKALADAMAHEWSGKEVELDKQPQLHVEMQMPEAGTHQELALLYGELLRNDKEVQDFQSKLITCLDAVDGKVTTQDAQIDDVARLVRELSAKLTGKTQLKSQCDALSIELLSISSILPARLLQI
ncbi:hypothetical protein GQ600_176 [Phytophthora cactorum]|nr:hypothetical protein GQ600_176 [Phytophthora cactorum]